MSSLSPKSAVVGYEHAIAGFAAGATATLLTYPLDLLRTRFQGAHPAPALCSAVFLRSTLPHRPGAQ